MAERVALALHCRCDPNGREACLGGCSYLCQRLVEERIRPPGYITYEEYQKRLATRGAAEVAEAEPHG